MSTAVRAAGWNAAVGSVVNPSTRRGGTLRLASSADLDSLDPARTYYVWVWLLQRMLNRTLMAYPAEPGPSGLVPVPDLAEAPGEVGAGGRTWTYRLRPGVRYDDGTLVTAEHLRYAVQRIFAQDVLPGGPTHLIPLLADPIRPYRGPYRDPTGLAAVRTPDPRTIVFHLRSPFADFDHLMTQPCTAPVLPAADTGAAYGDRPLCTGPYRVAEYRRGVRLSLVRNPCWDPASDPVRSALPDEVDVTIGMGVDELDDRVLSGEFDINLEGRGVQHAAQRRIMADPVLRAGADNPETGFLHYVSIQPQVPPFGDVRVRRAVLRAADRRLLLEARGGPVIGGDIATTLLPPRFSAANGQSHVVEEDLDTARAELTAVGLSGFDAVIGTQRGKFRLVAEAMAESLARIGIRLSIVELPVPDYYTTGIGRPATIRERELGLVVTDWGADFPTAHGFLAPLVDGRQIRRAGGNWNFAELDDDGVNALIDRTLHTTDPVARAALWHEVERRVLDAAVLLPITHDRTLHYRNPGVTNVFVHPAFGLYDVQAMGVA
jgi:peptide/nickel transport system substrate-binding protein